MTLERECKRCGGSYDARALHCDRCGLNVVGAEVDRRGGLVLQVQVDPEQVPQLLAHRQFSMDQVARVFAVPAHLVSSGPRLRS